VNAAGVVGESGDWPVAFPFSEFWTLFAEIEPVFHTLASGSVPTQAGD